MRVVAGTRGGRRIEAPSGRDTRPTTDRVREAVFNALGSLGAVEGAVAVDLFAGSGALGIEALSRGASEAHFVESDRTALAVLRRNLDQLDLTASATVHAASVEASLDRLPERIDLVLADPPYAYEGWPALLGQLVPRLCDDAVVVVESDRAVPFPVSLEVVRERSYGGTVVTFARPVDGVDTGADA